MLTQEETKKVLVMHKVNKEFREFRNRCSERGLQYVFDNGLKVAFYKEMKVYILNGIVNNSYYLEMYDMGNILDTLWQRYKLHVLDANKVGDHYLEQLLDLRLNNKVRLDYRNSEHI